MPASFWLPARFTLGFTKPRQPVLGSELSGIIEAAGKDVSKFNAGDKVFAFLDHRMGAYAEYVCIAENDNIALKPENLTLEQSAPLSFGGIAAHVFLKKSKIIKGEKILIYGASGSVGTYAVQLAKYLGAEVTAVCSTDNLKLMKSLGADNVIDYRATNIAKLNDKFDVIFDAVGKTKLSQIIKIIKTNGRYIHLLATPFTEFKIRLKLLRTKIKFIGGTYQATPEHINLIKKLAEEKNIKPVIDRQYTFDEIELAHEYVDKGHKKGNVIVKIR